MMHTHHGYGHDERSKTLTHDHAYTESPHDHDDEFLAIYLDEEDSTDASEGRERP